jgi:glycerol-3-phosphate dehydrogenase (NAD(P)+)
VEMPITEQLHAVLFAGKSPYAAVDDLLARAARDELTSQPLEVISD